MYLRRFAHLSLALLLLPSLLPAGQLKPSALRPARTKVFTPGIRNATPVPTPAPASSALPIPAGPTPVDPAAALSPFNEEEVLIIQALNDPPANDAFANAIVIDTPVIGPGFPSLPQHGDNINATKEPGEPNHQGNAGGHSVWWKWTAPQHTRVSLYSANSDFPTVLGVYTGTALNALIPVPHLLFTVQQPGAWFFNAPAGTTYYFAVDGVDVAVGNIELGMGTLAATPVTITSQPTNVTATAGSPVAFSITVSGTDPYEFQWYRNNVAMANETLPRLNIFSAAAGDAGSYHAVASNGFATVASATATLTVTPAPLPVITTQPASLSVLVGEPAMFSVVATGAGTLTYQWLRNGVPISGAGGSTFGFLHAQESEAATYSVRVTNAAGSVTSADAVLQVSTVATKPVITTQPVSLSRVVGEAAIFTVNASGPGPLTYQWLFNGVPISGANSLTYGYLQVQESAAGTYSVRVTNAAGSVTSADAVLQVSTVATKPVITTQPVSQTVTAGDNVVFSVAASGTGTVSYQWFFNGNPIPGGSSTNLTLNNAQTSASGSYRADATNTAGATSSATATLTVNAAVVTPTPVTPTPTPQPPAPSSGGGGGGGGGGGAPSEWFLAVLGLLTALRRCLRQPNGQPR